MYVICKSGQYMRMSRFPVVVIMGVIYNVVPSKRPLSMILYSPNSTGPVKDTQACLTLAQLLIHNCKKGY